MNWGYRISALIGTMPMLTPSANRVGRGSKKLQSPQPGERTVFFDEFAVYDRRLFYGWAERNTRPEVESDERKSGAS
jgi:hypothetical protein